VSHRRWGDREATTLQLNRLVGIQAEPQSGGPAFARAGVVPAAAGQRFLSSDTFLWYRQIARILREKLPNEAAKVPVRTMPDLVVKLLARRNPQMAMLRPKLGRTRLVDSSKARTQLGW
jgi:hypothetical protein